jgi:hypothetical protein
MGKQLCLGTAVAVFVILTARFARAAPGQFGEPGQWVVDDRFALSAAHGGPLNTELRYSTNGVRLAPSAAVFVSRKLSVGLGLNLEGQWFSFEGSNLHSSSYRVAVIPRVGYALPLGRHFDVWPEVGVRLGENWVSQSGRRTSKSSDVGLLVTAPLLWHPVSHFFVGVGPTFSYDFLSDEAHSLRPWYSSLGVTSLIGGYWGA